MAETGNWWCATHFYGSELTVDDFLVNSVRFEKSEAILWLAFWILASEEVNTFKNCVRFALISLAFGLSSVCHVHCATSTLNEGSHSIFDGQLDPFVEVEVEHEHLVEVASILGLATVNHHTLKVHGGTVILTGDY